MTSRNKLGKLPIFGGQTLSDEERSRIRNLTRAVVGKLDPTPTADVWARRALEPQAARPAEAISAEPMDAAALIAKFLPQDRPALTKAEANLDYEEMLGDENYNPRLCFTSALDTNFIPGAVGLIRSIRKFYGKEEADIVLFIDVSTREFRQFCREYSVDLHTFDEIESWVSPLVYDDPRYANDKSHFYHPDFEVVPGLDHHLDRTPEMGKIRHLHPLNVKGYCTGYCICVKNYRHVVHIDCDAFLLSRVDTVFERHNEPGTVIAFDDGSERLENLESLFDVKKPAGFKDTDYGFNAGVVFYVNNRAIKELARDFMFYSESCYHYEYAGYFADQGILRALVAKHSIQGNIAYHRDDAINWNPTWNRADNLKFNEDTQTWTNESNGEKQFIWHGAGGAKLWTGKYEPAPVNEAWLWVGGGIGNDWIEETTPEQPAGPNLYDAVLSNEDYIEKICFTACLNKGYRFGAMGLINSIRKFYTPDEADIVVFIDRDFEDFPAFCADNSVEIRYFSEINEWVQPLVYEDPLYYNDSTHFYHPDFEPHPDYYHHSDRSPGFGKIHNLHPLNVKAYCTGYCLCLKNYRFVVHIDCDAFLLARIDPMFEKHPEPSTVIGFEDDEDDITNLTPIFGIDKPTTFSRKQYGFNAGIVFYVNGRGAKQFIRDFMFYMESSYHYSKAGSYSDADQGLIRCVVAKNAILGHIQFHREDNYNWNPTWKRCENLIYNPDTDSWTNMANGQKQYIWHSPVCGGWLYDRLWTRRYISPSVNAAWCWAGGSYETWRSIKGTMSEATCRLIAAEVSSYFPVDGRSRLRILVIGAHLGRSSIALHSALSDEGYDVSIDACDAFENHPDYKPGDRTQLDHARENAHRFGMDDSIVFHQIGTNDNLAGNFPGRRFDFIYIDSGRDYKSVLADSVAARKLANARALVMGSHAGVTGVTLAANDIFGEAVDVVGKDHWIARIPVLAANTVKSTLVGARRP